MTLLSSPEPAFSFRFDCFHSDTDYVLPNSSTHNSRHRNHLKTSRHTCSYLLVTVSALSNCLIKSLLRPVKTGCCVSSGGTFVASPVEQPLDESCEVDILLDFCL